MSRRQLRERIFKLLFRIEFNKLDEMKEQQDLFFVEDTITEEDQAYITGKYEQIVAKLSEIDQALSEKAEGWDLPRMGKVDLTILRLGVYEIQYDEDVPVSVAINEAVELAKKFGQDESGPFINGILAKFAK